MKFLKSRRIIHGGIGGPSTKRQKQLTSNDKKKKKWESEIGTYRREIKAKDE